VHFAENSQINNTVMSSDIIEVGMAQMKISSSPDIITTRGLGSCVGVTLYDSSKKIGGLAHPMLPKRENYTLRSRPFKFVDYVISFMVEELEKQGSKKRNIEAKIFGGAHMFGTYYKDSIFNIGQRNIETAKEILASLNIKIAGEDVLGGHGRSIFLYLETGKVRVKTLFYGEKEL